MVDALVSPHAAAWHSCQRTQQAIAGVSALSPEADACGRSAQLIIGGSILKLNDFDLQTYSNKAVIAIDQDAAGKQAKLVMQYEQTTPNPYDPSVQQVRQPSSACTWISSLLGLC